MHVQKRIRGNGNALLLCEFADCQASAETCLNSNVNVFKCEHLRSVNLQTAADNGEVVLKDSVHEEITRPPSAIFNHIRRHCKNLLKQPVNNKSQQSLWSVFLEMTIGCK